jgi:hypothetical protein
VDATRGTVHVGGDFSAVGGSTRHRLAAVDASGAVSSWDPDANSPLGIFTLTATPSAGTGTAGGDFTGSAAAPSPTSPCSARGSRSGEGRPRWAGPRWRGGCG